MFMEKIIGLIDAPFTPFYANGDVAIAGWRNTGLTEISDSYSTVNTTRATHHQAVGVELNLHLWACCR